MSEVLLQELEAAIVASKQSTIFGTSNTEERVLDSCVRYLRFKGYTVVSPKKFESKITSNDDLIEYFYRLLNRQNPEDYATSYDVNRDRGIAKRFIEERMEVTGASKEYALNECGEIIRTIFKHYDEFNFTHTLNFGIFGQNKLKWITDNALKIMNKQLRKEAEERTRVLRQKALSAYNEPAGYDDLDELLAKMEEEKDG